MKGVILCAGQGTRMRPFTFSSPKSLLPVGNRPILDYCMQKLLDSGIREIGVVINPSQQIIAEYVDKYSSLCAITVIHQTEQLGISHALLKAQPYLGDGPFILLLGDNLIEESLNPLIEAYEEYEAQAAILLAAVDHPQDFGIAEVESGAIKSIVEKPIQPASNLAVIGAYLFDHSIFDAISRTAPSQRGELEITDAIQRLIEEGRKVRFSITKKPYHDVGTLHRWLTANEWVLEESLGSSCVIGLTSVIENSVIQGPVIIGEGCIVKNAVIGPHVSVQDGCTLSDCTISNSICLEGAVIRSSATLTRSIIGREAIVTGGENTDFKLSCYLGEKSELHL